MLKLFYESVENEPLRVRSLFEPNIGIAVELLRDRVGYIADFNIRIFSAFQDIPISFLRSRNGTKG